MASKVISFRLEDANIEQLEAYRQSDDESHSQIAQRLLKEILGGNEQVLTKASTNVDETEDKIKEVVYDCLQQVYTRLEAVEGKVAGLSDAKFRQEPEEIRDHYLASLKLGSQSPEYKRAKKHLDGFIGRLKDD